nr:HNH endonuclease family protein [Heyndrickxia coagulans]
MDSYIQMNFDPKVRKSLFTKDWTSIKDNINDFDSISECIPKDDDDRNSVPLIEILRNKKLLNNRGNKDGVENERFESIISFPNFLLQVNAVINKLEEEDSTLDDKHFLNNLSWAWGDADKAKNFLFHMLKCRVLFDKYILKREYARDYKETGKWSLQRLERYNDGKGDKPKYVGTFGEDNSQNNKQLRTLQSCLRITYTSPKTMHWISLVLTRLLENESCDIIEILKDYCKTKVIESKFENASGFDFERIVFTYLDYLLYKNGYSYLGKEIIPPLYDEWQFQFRNSIEHFQPQNPVEGESWEADDLDGFGNLALITVSGNSKFSNLPPEGKITSYPSIIEQSLKLKIMKELVNFDDEKWTEEKARKHKEEMFRVLKR